MSNASVKATRAAIQIGSLTVDGFMLPDGSYRMSQTQVAECIDLSERNAREWLKLRKYEVEVVEVVKFHQGQGATRIKALPLKIVVEYWITQASKGNTKALALLKDLSNQPPQGWESVSRSYIIPKVEGKKPIASEAVRVQQLKVELGGATEVRTPVGAIDLLTCEEIIEVKPVKKWKFALGQILAYGQYFPNYRKRIHLFGEADELLLALVSEVCNPLQVAVTWEP